MKDLKRSLKFNYLLTLYLQHTKISYEMVGRHIKIFCAFNMQSFIIKF